MSTPPRYVVLMGDGHPIDLDQPVGLTRSRVSKTLSKINRFGGHIPDEALWPFYSVAKHAVLVSHIVRKLGGTVEQQLMGLSHDDHEAIISDVITPVKRWLGSAMSEKDERLFRQCMGMMREQTGAPIQLDEPSLKIVEQADRMALIVEGSLLGLDVRHFQEALRTVRGLPAPSLAELNAWGLFKDESTMPFRQVIQSDAQGYLSRGRDLCLAMGLSGECFDVQDAQRAGRASAWSPASASRSDTPMASVPNGAGNVLTCAEP